MSGRTTTVPVGRTDWLVLGAVAATASAMAWRELLGPGPVPAPPGRLVQVGGRAQHVMDRPGDRGPTVVFENGLGNPATMWHWLREQLPPDSHLVAYDRPGVGWSRPVRGRLDAARYTDHLLALLREAGAQPPYLLVGHSLGGLLIRLFAERFPELAAGLVFVDSAHPDEHRGSAALAGFNPVLIRLDRWIARACLGMRPDNWLTADLAPLPPEEFVRTARVREGVGSLRAARRELGLSAQWAEACGMTGAGAYSSLPVAVVHATSSAYRLPNFDQYQEDLAGLSAVSRSWSVAGATHNSLLTRREHAAEVADAITWALDRASRATGHGEPSIGAKAAGDESPNGTSVTAGGRHGSTGTAGVDGPVVTGVTKGGRPGGTGAAARGRRGGGEPS
ncbi:alpha/beta hydrolase [Streptomyces sp. NBC_00481]|uniref:alpha/beta fold hydrolase n=1 Tax=unclassified Streptomyces TaxID=2593676 RepID=UPI002DDA89D5|nr:MULTISPECIES: alpha/beta hydrolase [unclassified Streptomyces]WRZ00392.1 alpha/beta hydrolase [Streptomyces sp. NBC_00481]